MLPFEDRYTRQRQLVEVGVEGQLRLESSVYELSASSSLPLAARVVAADYLRRAGVRVDADTAEGRSSARLSTESETPLLAHFHFEGPSHVAAGALVALNHIRSTLGIDGTKKLGQANSSGTTSSQERQ